jgi:2-polyprenyl-3-methyl-5-hydroxy-6-metoxy-1,4-benzoquinol methylase
MQGQTFNKYRELGAYHYDHTIGSRSAKDYDPRLAARYLNAVNLLAASQEELVLDAGSGEGVAALLCCRRGARAVAVELDSEACRLGEEIRAREGFSAAQLRFERQSLYQLSFEDSSFDGILSLEVIEHMDDVARYLAELRRVMKPGRKIVISTPLRRPDGKLHDPYHVQEYSAETLAKTLGGEFESVQVYSAWRGEIEKRYESNAPFRLIGQLKRRFYKYLGRSGKNIFTKPVTFDPQSPLLLAVAQRCD